SCELTLDPNTVSRCLSLCEENRKVVWVREEQSYPDHPERFDDWYHQQVLCRENLTGRCYWEAEWSGGVDIAVTYKGIRRKREGLWRIRDLCVQSSDVSVKAEDPMMDPHHFSSGGETSDSKLQTFRAEPPANSYVYMNPNNSVPPPSYFSNERPGTDLRPQTFTAGPPGHGYVYMNTNNSAYPPLYSSTERTSDLRMQTPLGYAPMKTNNSVPSYFSNEGTWTDLRQQTHRVQYPEPSCVSMESNSMYQPPGFGNARTSIDPRLQTYRAGPPEPSCVSMKSNNSMFEPPGFSNDRSSTDLRITSKYQRQTAHGFFNKHDNAQTLQHILQAKNIHKHVDGCEEKDPGNWEMASLAGLPIFHSAIGNILRNSYKRVKSNSLNV
ncbi:hypothetical protein NFI96_007737, partial [Prochilodus magdalenae]